MRLPDGARLGPYEILAPLGAGGMGEVYRARDTRLGRDVAIKILPALFASDSDRRARFEREGRAIAALSHPNILAIFDIGREGPTDYVVTELLEGQTVRDRVAMGPLPVRESLALAVQIVRGLAVAHDRGITHRDLKPENLFIAHDGTLKILDFGLAKLLDPGGPDVTGGDGTAAGSVMGTVGYMAPEQLRGQQVDHRADIFAFGAVLYEMLSGRRAFAGDSAADSISATLSAEPPEMDADVSGVHPLLARIVRRCLEKRPDARFQSAHDLVFALEAGGHTSNAVAVPGGGDASRVSAGQRRMPFIVIGALIVLAAAGVWLVAGRARPAPVAAGVSAAFTYALPAGAIFTRTGRRSVAISPDGTKIAFIANQRIYLRYLHDLDARPIRGTDVDPADLTFSPDGRSLAFFVPATRLGTIERPTLKRVHIDGGPLTTVAPGEAFGLRWQGSRILFSTGSEIQVVDETGGTPTTLAEATSGSGETLAQPQFLGDGSLLYQAGSDIVVQTLGKSERRVLLRDATDARVLPSGHLIFLRGETIFGQAFDTASRQLVGGAVPLVEGVRAAGNSRGSHADVADNGTLVYVPASGSELNDLIWVDRNGRETPTGAQAGAYGTLRLSPDGTKVVLSGRGDLRTWDVEANTLSVLTAGPEFDDYPAWTPDGRSIVYRSNPGGQVDIFRRAADGSGGAEQLTDDAAYDAPVDVATHVDPGLRSLRGVEPAHPQLKLLPMASARTEPSSLLFTKTAPAINAAISPDGRWLAYQAAEGSATEEVHVRPFPDVESGHWQISAGGGSKPSWTRGGRELVFLGVAADSFTRRYLSVSVPLLRPGDAFSHGAPVMLFESAGHRLAGHPGRTYAVTPDGSRFLIIKGRPDDGEPRPSLTVVTHWFDVIRARLSNR